MKRLILPRRLISLPLLIFLTSCSWRTPEAAIEPAFEPEFCTEPGSVEWLEINSQVEVGVYLPPCYGKHPEGRYPTVYLLPGFGGSNRDWFDWGVHEQADDLIINGEVPPFMMVTTDAPYDDLDAGFLTESVLPFIEDHYQAENDRRLRSAAGASLGGAAAYHIVFQHPDLFASVGIFGNGLVTGEEEMILAWLDENPDENLPRVFLNSGEGDTYMVQQAEALIALLDDVGVPHTEIFSPGEHAGDYWASNFPAYLVWLAEGWRYE